MDALMQIAGLLMLFGVTGGPLVALLVLLNRRDRRESALLGAVLGEFASPEFRGRLATRVRCALLGRGSVVRLHILGGSRDEVWSALTRLALRVPPSVRLVVEGTMDPDPPAPFTLETTGRHPLRCLHRPSVVTG
ncbi:MAG: hypothetical protein L0214_09330 [candidate division NC10 bacterium]|nr:hypothetical protein [candidate division NC10 bacterium]